MSTATDRLITDKEVAKTFSVSRSTVWAWADKGLIPKPVVSRNKFARWSECEVQAALAAMKNKEAVEAST